MMDSCLSRGKAGISKALDVFSGFLAYHKVTIDAGTRPVSGYSKSRDVVNLYTVEHCSGYFAFGGHLHDLLREENTPTP